ncbi:MAG: hypothetical protein P5702_15970 [Limnospira sp. PMC 1291.21]|uniref:Uncharacterized protein n=3 Tax=Limnospira TaxID=2596745 RepID=A0A9P1KGB9_9CYAN|nr:MULTISPECIES: hypothetical protein [Limnospira]EKD06816.1 hypothetical protein SPLC1_S520500 [Arthrospira platensis C1]MBD2668915.1 hypothetical protein [Arthrospira platensis FACHB-439]MDC0837535.1 hypothetical protein [Limnoraphis robusta]MDT9182627.1 hypothetical protein [Limnospira sp. PMC 289.06]MDY7054626.1 hypothetical protein [Limnospira fusiformis LS22]QJB26306.1 hypothetical protein HFV01_11425 [Limnospira fusiformis SAG 85.79]
MDILSVALLLGAIVASDEILNRNWQLSRRLLEWIDNLGKQSRQPDRNPPR